PTVLYNAMVHPLIPVAFKGVVWYQGESNASRAHQYRELFPALINDWRDRWGRQFPFYWVQLANFMAVRKQPQPSSWAELREAQSMTLRLPQTGEAVIIDIGEARDIHPKNKQDVGRRLAAWALAKDYGQHNLYSGPRFREMKIEGNQIRLSFDYSNGIVSSDGENLRRFEIAAANQKFVWANAIIEGEEIVVSADEVGKPVAVRYAWADNPEGANLTNDSGLPASPFRTDNWTGVTFGKR
ncbi:MAG: sialate O-acetylesterase, partial [Planctomycetota bacterium]